MVDLGTNIPFLKLILIRYCHYSPEVV